MAQAVDSPEEQLAATLRFVAAALADGVISNRTAIALNWYARRVYEEAVATVPVAEPAPAAAPPAPESRPEEPASRPTQKAPPPTPERARPATHPPVSRPATAPAPTAKPPAPTPQVPRPTPPAPPPPALKPVPAGPSWSERLGERLGAAWSRLSADFAANSLIYLGVLLSVVVIFVFFAFGYFGEAVANPGWRSLIFLAAPFIFFALAWVLRHRVDVPAAADAVGLIGALSVPIMLSGLFQDDSTWGHYWGEQARNLELHRNTMDAVRIAQAESLARFIPLSWVPNLDGSARWVGYATVGLICVGIYYVLARRHRIYAYMVAPMAWAAVGALGLYWTFGMSGPQMLTVLGAIGMSLIAAIVWRDTRIARTIGYQTIRVGVVATPVVVGFALLFAYNDAIERGIAAPSLSDLAYPGAGAAGLLAAVLAISSGTGFAWENLGERTRASIATGLRIGAYLAAGVAVVLALSYQATPGWIGAVLVGYGIAVAAVDAVVGGTGEAPTWIARGTILVGAALALTDPWATIVVWTAAALIAMTRAESATIRRLTGSMLPSRESPIETQVELWIPTFVLMGAGVARVIGLADIPWALLGAGAVAAASRLLPASLSRLRSFAGVPSAVFVAAAVLVGWNLHLDISAYSLPEIGFGLLAVAAISAVTTFPWGARLPFVVAAFDGAAIAFFVDAIGPSADGITIVVASVLAATGVALVASTYLSPLRPWALAHGVAGHVALYGAIAASITNSDAALVALGAAIVVHGTESMLVDRGRVPTIEAAIEIDSSWAWLRDIPSVATAVAVAPFTVALTEQFAWFAEGEARVAVPLAVLGIGYAAAGLIVHRPGGRNASMAMAAITGTAAIALPIAMADGVVATVALSAGAVTAMLLAIALAAPLASALGWLSAYAAIAVGAYEAGVPTETLYRPVMAAALVTTVVSAALVGIFKRRTTLWPWLATATVVASAATAGGMVLAVADATWLWAWAVVAAAATLATALAYHAGYLVVLTWLYSLVAYVDAGGDWIESDAVALMPFAAAAVLVSAVLPGRRSRDVNDPAVLTLGVALATMAVTVGVAVEQGTPGATLAWCALVVSSISAIRGERSWLHLAAALIVAAGASAAGPWLTAGLAIAALVETTMALPRREGPEGMALPWVATTLWGTTAAAAAEWLDLGPGAVVTVALSAGAALTIAALTAWLRWPNRPGVRRWTLPVGLLGQTGLAVAGLQATVSFERPDALLIWACVAWLEAGLVGVPGTLARSREAVWLSAGLMGAATGLTLVGFEVSAAASVWTLAATGTVASSISLLRLSAGQATSRAGLWVLPAGVLGQAALAGAAVQAWAAFMARDAVLTSAAIAWIEALLVGIPATTRRSASGVWASAVLFGAGGALALRGLQLDWLEAVWATALIGGALLTVWLVSVVATNDDRMVLWRLPTATLAQAAFIAAAVAAGMGLPVADAYLTWWVLLAIDAAAIGLAATITTTRWMAAVSTAMVIGALALALRWIGLEAGVAWIWLGVLAAAAGSATVVTRLRSRPWAMTWVPSLQLSVLAVALIAINEGTISLAPRDALLLGSVVAACIGAHLVANREWLEGYGIDGGVLGATGFVISAALVAVSLGSDDWWAMPTLLSIATGGVAAAGISGASTESNRISWAIAALGFTLVGTVGSAVLFPPISLQFGWMLIVNGAAFAAFSITGRAPAVLHLAVVTWLVGILVLIEHRWTLELLATVTAVSAVLLVMVEVERLRQKRRDEMVPDWLRIAEWALMVTPMALAAREMATDSLTFGLLLGFEGVALLAWGIVSEVRRRAVLGLTGITAAVLMAVMVPLVQGIGGSLSGGWWLVIGGTLAVVFIATGSMLEKYRTRIGERLTRTSEILERWE